MTLVEDVIQRMQFSNRHFASSEEYGPWVVAYLMSVLADTENLSQGGLVEHIMTVLEYAPAVTVGKSVMVLVQAEEIGRAMEEMNIDPKEFI